ncbi:MAG: arginase family protein [Aquiluna sp.]
MSEDPKWPRAASLISNQESQIAIIDIPASNTSISPTNAHLTPKAIRAALARYSTFSYATGQDLSAATIEDLGQIADPDGNEQETISRIASADKKLLIALGGDNSITYAAALGAFKEDLSTARLITLDAHHDLRDGISNGSPVRRLIDAGLNPKYIFQIGINDFSNSFEYASLAKDLGINVISRNTLATIGIQEACNIALKDAEGPVFVDIDVDVCDRSVVPACPAAAPGGISAFELRQAARILAASPKVVGMDITEIDASKDTEDQRTVRLGALLVLEMLAGFRLRS